MAVYCIKTSLNSVVFANSILCLSLVARYTSRLCNPHTLALQLLQWRNRHRGAICSEGAFLALENLPAPHRQRYGTSLSYDHLQLFVFFFDLAIFLYYLYQHPLLDKFKKRFSLYKYEAKQLEKSNLSNYCLSLTFMLFSKVGYLTHPQQRQHETHTGTLSRDPDILHFRWD